MKLTKTLMNVVENDVAIVSNKNSVRGGILSPSDQYRMMRWAILTFQRSVELVRHA